ncbi:hypothetical protein WICPIJ_000465 [Wickerhamomyces pijperi]|uniref:V-type ATPase assembly factor PKR1 n=1 Tax=Wickerhamomyces pijperi TaxID=599730 RepID=A0A9P8QGM4_WICPI|nr:hypothetical protein WICPIJ_000465 [Wickerhamomyces pijperi]
MTGTSSLTSMFPISVESNWFLRLAAADVDLGPPDIMEAEGTTPTLILATHISFALLSVSLIVFVILTNFNFHLCNLLVLSLALWAAITWFISELAKDQQQQQEKETKEKSEEEEEPTKAKEQEPKKVENVATPKKTTASGVSTPTSAPKRQLRRKV